MNTTYINPRNLRSSVLLIVLFSLFSCGKHTTTCTPTLLKETQLKTSDELVSGPIFESLKRLDKDHLLLISSNVSKYSSKLYKINTNDYSVIEYPEAINVSLAGAVVSIDDEMLVFSNRSSELEIVDINTWKKIGVVPSQQFFSTHQRIGNYAIVRGRSTAGHIPVLVINLEQQTVEEAFTISQTLQENWRDSMPYTTYMSAAGKPQVIFLDENHSGKLSLVTYDIRSKSVLSEVTLDEYGGLTRRSKPQSVHVNNDNAYIASRDYMSCRRLSDGKLLWEKAFDKPDGRYATTVTDDVIISVTEEHLTCLDAECGKELWQKALNPLGVFWYSIQNNLIVGQDHLMFNHFPIRIDDGHSYWNTLPDFSQDLFTLHRHRPVLDQEKGLIYICKDNVLHEFDLPEHP